MITPSEVVEYAFTPREQISPRGILPLKIDIASEHFVRPRFGDKLYERFVEGEYSPFVDTYLKPALAYYVRYALIDELSIQMSDNGAVLFENVQQQSQQSKSSISKMADSLTTINIETLTNQSIADIVKSSEQSTQNSVDSTITGNVKETDERSFTSEDKKTDSFIGETLTKADSKKSIAEQLDETMSETTVLDGLRNDDYSYHEAPVVIGVGREGYNHSTVDDDKKVNGTKTHNTTSSDDANSTVNEKADNSRQVSDKLLSTTKDDLTRQSSQANESTSTTTAVGEDATKQTVSDNRTMNSERESNGKNDKTSEDTGEASNSLRRSRPATDFQRRIIKARALADANILLNKAVRYVERNTLLFPEYRPLPRSYGRIVL